MPITMLYLATCMNTYRSKLVLYIHDCKPVHYMLSSGAERRGPEFGDTGIQFRMVISKVTLNSQAVGSSRAASSKRKTHSINTNVESLDLWILICCRQKGATSSIKQTHDHIERHSKTLSFHTHPLGEQASCGTQR